MSFIMTIFLITVPQVALTQRFGQLQIEGKAWQCWHAVLSETVQVLVADHKRLVKVLL